MELPIKIIVTIIVILVAAFVILAYFSGGIGNVSKLVQNMIDSISGGPGADKPGTVQTCEKAGGLCKNPDQNAADGCKTSVIYLATGCPSNTVCCSKT